MAKVLLGSAMAAAVGLICGALASPPQTPDGQQWQMIPALSDEFNGAQLDASKWSVGLGCGWHGRPPSEYKDANTSAGEGFLRLKTTARVRRLDGVWDQKKSIWVDAACIRSVSKIATPGYYEARFRASRLRATSSFWMHGSFSEIDINESIGVHLPGGHWQPEDMHASTHYFPHGWAHDQKTADTISMPSPVTEWHTYGVWWKDQYTVEFYLDDQLVKVVHLPGSFHEPMWLMFDTEVFPNEGLPSIEDLGDPGKNTMLVDWVRAYRLVPAQ